MIFDNLNRQLEKCSSLNTPPLEEALCLMDMVSKDIYTANRDLPIDDLPVENWKRLLKFLLSLTGTLNRILNKHGAAIEQNMPRKRNLAQESQDSLRSAEAKLRELEGQESGLRDEIRELESIVNRQKLKDQLVTQLLGEKQDLEQRVSRLKSVDLTRLEQERDRLAEESDALATQISDQQGKNAANARKLQSDRSQLQQEQQTAAQLRTQLDSVTRDLDQAKATCAGLNTDIQNGQSALQTHQALKQQLEQQLQSLAEQLRQSSSQSDELTEQIRQREEELGRLTLSITQLTQTNGTLAQQLNARQTELQTLQSQKQQLEQQLQAALTDKVQLEHDLAHLRTLLQNAADSLAQLKTQLSEGETLLRERQKKLAELTRTLSEQNAELARINDEIRSLEGQTEQLAAEITARRAHFEDLTARKEQLQQTKLELEQAIAELEQAIAELDAANSQLRDQKAALEDTLANDQEAYDALLSEYHALEETKTALDQALSELTAKKTALEQTIAGLTNTRHDLQAQVDRLEQEHAALCEALEQLRTRKEQLPGQIRTVTEDKSACEADCARLQQTLDQLHAELEAAADHKAELEIALADARNNKEQLDAECARLLDLLDQLSGVQLEREETAQRHQEAQTQLAQAKATVQDLNNAIAEHDRQTVGLNDQAVGLRADCAGAKALHEQAQIEHDALCESLNNTRQSTEAINARRIELQSQLDEADAALKVAKADAEQKEQDLTAAKNAYQEIDTSILTLGRQLQKQIEANTDYHDNHLLPARRKLDQAQTALAQDRQELADAEQQLKELEETCSELSRKTNQTKILINAEILNKEQRDRALLNAETELNGKLADAERERTENQAKLDKLNQELYRLTAGVIQPLLEDIAKAEKTLQEKGSKVVLQRYEQLKAEKEELVHQVEVTLAKLPALEQELTEQRTARDKAQAELFATQTSIREMTAEHDKLRSDLSILDSEEERRRFDLCQQRLKALVEIRQALIDRSRESGFGMEYKDALKNTIKLASDTMRDIQSQITAYSDLFSKKLGS